MKMVKLVCSISFLMNSRAFRLPFLATLRRSHSARIAEENSVDFADFSNLNSPFLKSCRDRGYLHQCTNLKKLDDNLSSGIVKAYLGFDATAESLHVGSLLQIMILRELQLHGHKPIVLIGGGTTKIGDPSGKDESRTIMTEETIQKNVASLSKVFEKFLKFGDGPTDAILVNNNDWLGEINYLTFLRDFGRHVTVNRMLSFDSVKTRLQREQPLTFLEFNYMLLQAYDFVQLRRNYGVTLQLGGSDQWGNIVNGIELSRKIDKRSLYGLTTPLMTTADGRKMGKSESGAVWLNKDFLSEFEYWQFWRNCADADVIKFLKLFSGLPLEQIQELSLLQGEELNRAKVILADAATSLLHGSECLSVIHATAKTLFAASNNSNSTGSAADWSSLKTVELAVQSRAQVDDNNANTNTNANINLKEQWSVVDLLVLAQLAVSKGEAKRLITGGGCRINDVKITDILHVVTSSEFDSEGRIKLSSGKKNHVVVKIVREK